MSCFRFGMQIFEKMLFPASATIEEKLVYIHQIDAELERQYFE